MADYRRMRADGDAATADDPFGDVFLVIDGWHGVLGRNVLNNLSLLFDGPNQRWMEQPP